MEVCQINSCYGWGSTGRIVENIHYGLKEIKIDSIICTAMDKSDKKNRIYSYGIKIEKYICAAITRITGNHYGYAFFQTNKLLRILKKENPDIIHIHCANCYDTNIYKLLNWCGKHNKKVVLTEHAEYYYTGNCSHAFDCEQWITGCIKCPNKFFATKSKIIDSTHKNWIKMHQAINKLDRNLTIISVSDWVKNRSSQSLITKNIRHMTIMNGINTDIFHFYDLEQIDDSIKKLFYRSTVLHVTPNFNSEIKGGKFVIELAKKLPNISFLVVGQKHLDNLPSNIVFIPSTNNQKELAMYYSMADLTLLTSKRETFSMVVAESLCCGTPVVGFKAGGPETITIKKYSEFVEYGEIQELENALLKWLEVKLNKKAISKISQKNYDNKIMCEAYRKIYEEML